MAQMPPRGGRFRSWKAPLLCVGLLLCAALILHREVVFGGAVYHMDDAADGYYPGHIAVARAFANGELPTWERGSWCGWPLVVDPYNGVFYPLNVIYLAVGAARGLGYAIVFHIVLGGAGMWLLLRRRKLALEAALFGALAYTLSTFGVVRIRHVIFVQMMGWLPWILVGVEGWVATRRLRELALVAAATGLALIAGALSIGHFAALAIAGFTVGRAWQSAPIDPRQSPWKSFVTDVGALGGAACLGALIAAVQLVPTLAHLPYSPRSLGSDYAFASSYAWPDAHYLYTLVAPDWFGGEDRLHYVGAPNHWELAGWYVGALCVVFALGSLVTPRSDGRRRGAELFALVGLVGLAIGLAFGDAGPLHPFFFKHVPLYAALRCPARALLMSVLALPILGAQGVEALLERARPSPLRPRLAWAGAALIAIAGVAAAIHFGHPPRGASQLDLNIAGASAHLAWVLAAGMAIALVTVAGGVPRRVGGLGLALVLAIDLLAIGRGYVMPQPADYPSGMERFAAVDWLVARTNGGHDRFVNDPAGPFRLHNLGMVLNLENASGYDSVGIWRYVNFLYLLQNGHPYPEKKLKSDFAGIGVHNLSSRLIDLMNVRWLLSDHAPDARWKERFSPPSPSGAPAAKFEPGWDPRMKVFENLNVLPRAFVVYRATVPGSDERLAARLTSPTFDPGREVLLEEAPPIALDGEARPLTPATWVEIGRQKLVLETDTPAPGILFVGDAHYPGWRAFVDGTEVKLLRADWAFRGVALPAGRHRVEMRYESRPVRLGALLTLLGLLGVTGLLLFGRR